MNQTTRPTSLKTLLEYHHRDLNAWNNQVDAIIIDLNRRGLSEIAEIVIDLNNRDLLHIPAQIAVAHHVLLEELFGEDRSRPSIHARHAFWAELYSTGIWSYPRLASLARKHHTTIVLGVRAHRKRAAAARLSNPARASA
jgi:hypothetical protein